MKKWLDKYEQGGLVLKKKTKDNYGVRENPNDVETYVPPGFVGMGNDISGRNYSPAWGGQFAMGGSVPGSVGFTYARTINPAPSEGPYAKKTMPSAQDGTVQPTVPPQITPVAQPGLSPKDFTLQYIKSPMYRQRLLTSGYQDIPGEVRARANQVAGTNISYQDSIPGTGSFYNQRGQIAIDRAQAKNLLHTPEDVVAAHEFSHPELQSRTVKGFEHEALNTYDINQLTNRLNPELLKFQDAPKISKEDKHNLSPIENKADLNAVRYQLHQKGADVFNKNINMEQLQELKKNATDYVTKRAFKNYSDKDLLILLNTVAQAPQQAPDANAIPTAQNGQEMKYWQEGLDWKPKSISKNGGWLNKYAEGGELPPEVIVEAPPEFVPLEDVPGEPSEPKNSPKKQSDFIYDQNERRSRHSFLESSFNPRAESSKINAKGEKEIIAVGPFGIRDIAIKDYNRLTGENLTRNDAYDFKTAGKIRNVLLDSYDNYDILQDPKLSRENKIRIKYGMYNAGPGTFAKEYNAIKEKYGVYNNPTWYKHLNRETGDYVTRATTRGDSKWEEEYKKGLKQHPDVVRKLRHKDGGNITKDDNGYWNPDNWGKPVEIGSNDITMQGVNQPLLGISDTGDTQYMVPGKDYKFKGNKVREFPIAQNGLRQEQKSLQNLDNLTNFTNYNTPQKGGWLQKYSK